MQCRPRHRGDKSERAITQCFTRCATKQYMNNYQINAVLMTLEAKKSVNVISKSGCPNLNALNVCEQYS